MQEIILKAPAKINLTLEVLKKRKDGYHQIRSVSSIIALFDEIKIQIKKNKPNNFSNPNLDALVKKNLEFRASGYKISKKPQNQNNCFLAVALFLKKFAPQILKDYKIFLTLKKNIPIASGLGGSSTDMVSVVYGLIKLFDLKINQNDLRGFLNSLGSDLMIFYLGGVVSLKGKGDKAKQIKEKPINLPMLLVFNKFQWSAKQSYQKLDVKKLPQLRVDGSAKMISLIKKSKVEEIANFLYNDLELSNNTDKAYLIKIKQYLKAAGSLGQLMSGSGPTVYAIFKNNRDLEKAYKNLSKVFGKDRLYLIKSQ
ncbi:MAG: hypothetical protein GF335_02730 [Candidatus Moranbacteria bacterium]|nr:hypothetical protein [Candidatus Moranbacteria bacterium]